jgi:hypothetical protein
MTTAGQETFSKAYGLEYAGGIALVPGTNDFLLCNTVDIHRFSFHRMDSVGDLNVTHTYSVGTDSNVIQDGCIPIARTDGSFTMLFGGHEYFTLKGAARLFNVNPDGTANWNRRIEFEAPSQNLEYLMPNNFRETVDGGYLLYATRSGPNISGSYGYSPMLVKLNQNGDVVWNKGFHLLDRCGWRGGSALGPTGEVLCTFNSSPVVALGNQDLYFFKVSAAGETLWSRFIQGAQGWLSDVVALADGYVMFGRTADAFLIIKVDGQGQLGWAKTYPLVSGGLWMAPTAVAADDGGFIVAGYLWTGLPAGILMLKVDSLGAIEWVDHFADGGWPMHSIATADNSVLGLSIFEYTGWTQIYRSMVRKVGQNGFSECATDVESWLAEENLEIQLVDTVLNEFDTLMTSQPLYLEEISPMPPWPVEDTCVFVLGGVEHQGIGTAMSASPNPFSELAVLDAGRDMTNAMVILFASTGEEVRRLPITSRYTVLRRGSLPSGVYFYRVIDERGEAGSGRLVIE